MVQRPHSYATDRICMVIYGAANFAPDQAVAVPAARTFHYDGVPSGIAVFGLGPVDIEIADPKQPPWRKV